MSNSHLPINRMQAIELLKSMPQAQSDMNHYLQTEAIMRAFAIKLGEDEQYWSMLGLLHDVDWALTKNDCANHCILAQKILSENGFDEEFIQNIQSHAYGYEQIPTLKEKNRQTKIQHALCASETLTGIIYAYALMRKKDISTMDSKGLYKKFKDKKFAANCNRQLIKEIEFVGLSLDEFFAISIDATKKIKDEIGLV